MAQNVGPILEMVTEKYLLRSEAEWQGRQQAMGILDDIVGALRDGDVQRVGALTTQNFNEPIQTIIPWASNYFTETLIRRVREEFGPNFWGFWMLGGMAGGGMGFIFDPAHKARAQERLQIIMSETKQALRNALPFAMEPVVYDFAINERGTWADRLAGPEALLPRSVLRAPCARLAARRPANIAAANARRTQPVQRRLPHPTGAERHDVHAV